MSKQKIYLLPGMGADQRLYDHLDLKMAEVEIIDWKPAPKNSSLREYARLMLEHVEDPEDSIFGGTSMGGIVAREMAEIANPKSLILISSPATTEEFSALTRLGRKLKIWNLVNENYVEKLGLVFERLMQIKTSDGNDVFNEMLRKADAPFLKWSVKRILEWERKEPYENYFQVVGEKDLLFSPGKMKSPIVIEKAGHMAVYENAREVGEAIDRYLRWI